MNKKLLTLLALFTVILSLAFVSSADVVTVITPTAGSTLSGTVSLNVTNSTSFNTMINCSFYFKSSLSENNTWTLVGAFKNNSLINVNGTFSAAILEDANDYILNASCWNTTSGNSYALVTGLILNSTVPDAPVLSPTTNSVITSAQTVSLSGIVTRAKTTSCTYTFYRGGSAVDTFSSSGSASYSTTNCSFSKTVSSASDNGNYYFTITASDGSDTASSTNVLVVNIPGNSGGGSNQELIVTNDNLALYIVIGVVFLCVIVAVIVLSTSKDSFKHKHKRRR